MQNKPNYISLVLTHWLLKLIARNNTLRPRQNGQNFPDDIFKYIFLNETIWILNTIRLNFVPTGPGNGLALTRHQAIIWTNDGLGWWRIFVSCSLNELRYLSISCAIALRWMSHSLTEDLSTLFQIMACCLTAPSHHLKQCWQKSLP